MYHLLLPWPLPSFLCHEYTFHFSCSSELLCILHISAQPLFPQGGFSWFSPCPQHTHTHTHTHTGSSWWSLGVWYGPQSPSKSESLFCVFLAISGSSKIFWLFLNLADHQNDEESLLLFVFWSHRMACGILVPRLGIEPMLSAVEAQSLNPWTNWEVLRRTFSK